MSESIPESLTTFEAARQAAVCLDVADRERFAEWFAEWHRLVTPARAAAAAGPLDPFLAHEALDRCHVAGALFTEQVAEHAAVAGDPDLRAAAERASTEITRLYEAIADRNGRLDVRPTDALVRVSDAWLDAFAARGPAGDMVLPEGYRDLALDLRDARARIRQLEDRARPRCAFCKWPVPLDVPDDEMRRQIAEHMLTCAAHPCAALMQHLAHAWTICGELLAALKRLNAAAFWRGSDESDPTARGEFEIATKLADDLIKRVEAAETPATPGDVSVSVFVAAPDLLEELKAVEWGGMEDHPDGGHYGACPCCGGGDPDNPSTPEDYEGHADDCSLAAAIAKAEGRTAPVPSQT